MSWAHAGSDDPEFAEFTASNARGAAALVFGRITYEMMAGFWPTPAAAQRMPEVAAGMNRARKYVFSHRLEKTDWANTTILHGDPAAEIARLKRGDEPQLKVMGSGSIVKQLTAAGADR
jgi:dihydrofolate reductase